MDHRDVFVQVVEQGSFTAAASTLGVSTSYVSRCVRQLEERLGVTLLARSTRSVRPTEAGVAYHARVAPLLEGLVEADLEVGARTVEPRGTLRIAMPHVFGRRWVMPTVLRFQQRWPEVRVEAQLSDRFTDPLAADVTLRGGRLPDAAGLVARRLVDFQEVLAASPDFIAGHPVATPSDLDDLPACLYTARDQRGRWTLRSADGECTHTPRSVFEADSGEAVVQAALAGLGVILQPGFLVGPLIARGELVRVLPDWEGNTGHFWALLPSRMMPATVRHFVDALAEDLAGRPWDSEGVA